MASSVNNQHWQGEVETVGVNIRKGLGSMVVTESTHTFDITSKFNGDVDFEWEYKHAINKRDGDGNWQVIFADSIEKPDPLGQTFTLGHNQNYTENDLPIGDPDDEDDDKPEWGKHISGDVSCVEDGEYKLDCYTRINPHDPQANVNFGADIKHSSLRCWRYENGNIVNIDCTD